MSPLKLIICFIVFLLVIRLIRRFIGRMLHSAVSGGRRPRQTAARAGGAKMVRCRACGTFITESSALVVGESGFCSKACAERKLSRA
jgi:hypothetical protein